jgi:acetyl esterase/lipase
MARYLAAIPIALVAWLTPAGATDNVWTIGPRTLPPPDGASPELRRSIAAMPAPAPAPTPTTLDGWRKYIAETDAVSAARADALIERFKLDVAEDKIAGVRVYRLTPPQIAARHAGRLFVHVHGGGFILGNGRAALDEAAQIAGLLKMPVLSIDYRMAPDHPAPAAMDDVIAVWSDLLKTHNPASLALGGTSAGGNLTLVSTLRMKDLGLPRPAALLVGTPVVDLDKRGDSRFLNDGIDHVLHGWEAASAALSLYVGGKSLDDPYLSPIRGDVGGFPPTYLVSGTRDLLLSDTVRMHRKLRQAGVPADLHVYEGFAHADYIELPDTPESVEHYAELDAFLSRHLAGATGAGGRALQ